MSFRLVSRDIDRVGSVPLYRQIADRLQHAIETGELKPGDALPSEAEMERSLGISRTVIRDGMAELVRDGLVVKRHGAATRVADKPRQRRMDTSRYQEALDVLDKGGERPQTSAFVDEHDTTWDKYEIDADYRRDKANPRDADYLKIKIGSPVVRRLLLKIVDGKPEQIQRSTIPLPIAKGTHLEKPEVQPYPGGTIAELYDAGHRVTQVIEDAWARMPTGDERRMLQQVQPGPVWDIVRVFCTKDGPVEASRVITPAADNLLRFVTDLH
ncbi:GntR family transcriptional regulator [Microlunatus speluncae]|uniref:GntR family transcriptional regulator n=1 Tax=Microlunatus speluncae TaxID=2594267 RepID=UPI001375DE20|nr:GntR family transcriptional regulator [Microlunatus speluncae]